MPRDASYWYSLAKDTSWKEKDTIEWHTDSKDLEVRKLTCRCSLFLIFVWSLWYYCLYEYNLGICLVDGCPYFLIEIAKQVIRVAKEFGTHVCESYLFDFWSTVKFSWVSKMSCQTISIQNWGSVVFWEYWMWRSKTRKLLDVYRTQDPLNEFTFWVVQKQCS